LPQAPLLRSRQADPPPARPAAQPRWGEPLPHEGQAPAARFPVARGQQRRAASLPAAPRRLRSRARRKQKRWRGDASRRRPWARRSIGVPRAQRAA